MFLRKKVLNLQASKKFSTSHQSLEKDNRFLKHSREFSLKQIALLVRISHTHSNQYRFTNLRKLFLVAKHAKDDEYRPLVKPKSLKSVVQAGAFNPFL